MSKHSDVELQNGEDSESEFVSKTQLKQQAEQLKKLGLNLVDLKKGERDKIPLDDELLSAIELAIKINRKKDGFRRQLQFIGKLLRSRDIEEIETALQRLKSAHLETNKHFHLLEKLRDDIVAKGDKAINEVIEAYPNLERQKLRQLHRQAQQQSKQNKPPVASREIFQYLKSEISPN